MLPGFELENQKKAREIYSRLSAKYGEHPLMPYPDPMYVLIRDILSARTKGPDTDRAFERMWTQFGSWEAIRDADVAELTEAIAPVTYPENKAPQIKATLRKIFTERGEASIDFLGGMTTQKAWNWLRSLPGAGPKTASMVLLFCFSKPMLPVETHVHRVSERLGLVEPGTSREAAPSILMDLLPSDPHVLSNFYGGMHTHGRKACVFGRPLCGWCTLTDLCDWYDVNVGRGRETKI